MSITGAIAKSDETVYCVLVLDRGGDSKFYRNNWTYTAQSPKNYLDTAACTFVENILKNSNNIRIAVVSYNEYATVTEFTNDIEFLKKEIKDGDISGNRNIALGLETANEALKKENGNIENKKIVLFTTGHTREKWLKQ